MSDRELPTPPGAEMGGVNKTEKEKKPKNLGELFEITLNVYKGLTYLEALVEVSLVRTLGEILSLDDLSRKMILDMKIVEKIIHETASEESAYLEKTFPNIKNEESKPVRPSTYLTLALFLKQS